MPRTKQQLKHERPQRGKTDGPNELTGVDDSLKVVRSFLPLNTRINAVDY